MKPIHLPTCTLLLLSTLGLMACEPPNPGDPSPATPSPATPSVEASATSSASNTEAPITAPQEKPGAPIQVAYKVLDTPAVGKPVQVELTFDSSRPNARVRASYRIVDQSALSFAQRPTEKMPVSMQSANGGSRGVYRLRVVPQREGQHYLNVLTEIDTGIGVLTKSTSIPIRVGRNEKLQSRPSLSPPQADIQVDESGEAIISLPAQQEKKSAPNLD